MEGIISIAEDCGKTHDFKLYKDTIGGCILDEIKARMGSGYQGVAGIHANSETPKKKPKGGELTKEEISENRRIFRGRILIEHINAKIKVFRIMVNKYCNRRKCHDLCANLICGIINFETRI